MRILVTRPLKQSIATQTHLMELGHEIIVEPLLTISPLVTPQPTGEFAGAVLTSVHAVGALSRTKLDKDILLFTTGMATQLAAYDAGFKNCITVEGSSVELVKTIPLMLQVSEPQLRNPKLLYPCAQETAHDLPALLQPHNITCTQWPVYRSTQSTAFSDSTRGLLQSGDVDAVLLYSPKTANCFTKLMGDLNWPDVYTLSEQIAAQLPSSVQDTARFPKVPNEEALLALLPK